LKKLISAGRAYSAYKLSLYEARRLEHASAISLSYDVKMHMLEEWSEKFYKIKQAVDIALITPK